MPCKNVACVIFSQYETRSRQGKLPPSESTSRKFSPNELSSAGRNEFTTLCLCPS